MHMDKETKPADLNYFNYLLARTLQPSGVVSVLWQGMS